MPVHLVTAASPPAESFGWEAADASTVHEPLSLALVDAPPFIIHRGSSHSCPGPGLAGNLLIAAPKISLVDPDSLSFFPTLSFPPFLSLLIF